MSAPTRVVCLGGGFSAIYLSRVLRPAIRRGEVELTVVSRENFHTFHGFIAEMLTGKLQPEQILSPARRMFPPARFHCAEIESVDLERRVVTTSRALDGKQFLLPYDHLVVGLGSADDNSRYPGLAEHALKLKTYWDCFRTRNHLLTMLELAEIEPDPAERRRLLSFVIAGGNYGGIEVAAELNDWARGLVKKEYRHVDPAEVSVTVVHSGDRILPELGAHQPKLQAWAQRYLVQCGVTLKCNTRVAAATADEVHLSSGERIQTRTVITCTGLAMPPLLDTLPFERDERGRLVTDEFARVRGQERIWASGDCAAVPHPDGGTCPPLAIFAMMVGRNIGENVLHTVRGQPLRPYSYVGLGDACTLGRRRAVGHVKGIRIYGFPAWLTWRAFLLRFVPTWDRKVRMLVDFLLWPVLGRDVVNPRIDLRTGMRRELFEPGQDVVREGDVGHRLFMILSGEVDVIRRDPDGRDAVVATLGPGSHFGERAVFQNVRRTATVRARSRVELVSLGRQEAATLAAAAPPLQDALRHTPRPGSVGVPAEALRPLDGAKPRPLA